MLIIPAIDIRGGKCVRLRQGEFSKQTIYSENPIAMARHFSDCGAQMLHVVDLDGAKSGQSPNHDLIANLVKSVAVPVQLGGGIRTLPQMFSWLAAGVQRVIVGTIAVQQPEILRQALQTFGGEQIILGVDARDGRAAVAGWQEDSGISAIDLILQFKKFGLQRVIYTDIARDGMLTGANLAATREVAERTQLRITASGGIASREDLQRLEELEPVGVDSVIIGRAFYEGRILPEEVF